MSLTNVPSPMARPVVVPFRASVPRSHVVPATVQARQAGHPCAPYDHELDEAPAVTVLLALSLAEAARIRTLLERGEHPDDVATAATIRRQMSGRDDCPPRGLPRPGGVA